LINNKLSLNDLNSINSSQIPQVAVYGGSGVVNGNMVSGGVEVANHDFSAEAASVAAQ